MIYSYFAGRLIIGTIGINDYWSNTSDFLFNSHAYTLSPPFPALLNKKLLTEQSSKYSMTRNKYTRANLFLQHYARLLLWYKDGNQNLTVLMSICRSSVCIKTWSLKNGRLTKTIQERNVESFIKWWTFWLIDRLHLLYNSYIFSKFSIWPTLL
jgi:hypothetical protein